MHIFTGPVTEAYVTFTNSVHKIGPIVRLLQYKITKSFCLMSRKSFSRLSAKWSGRPKAKMQRVNGPTDGRNANAE